MTSTHSVFTYGTLQIPEVMKLVVGQDLSFLPARLNGYQRLQIKNRTYPGIIKNKNYSVEGILYEGVSDHGVVLLDQFVNILVLKSIIFKFIDAADVCFQ